MLIESVKYFIHLYGFYRSYSLQMEQEHQKKRESKKSIEGQKRRSYGRSKAIKHTKTITGNDGFVQYRQIKDGKIMYIPYARMIMEKHLKRPLLEEEKIEHLDGNNSNCKIENLRLITNDLMPLSYGDKMEIKETGMLTLYCKLCDKTTEHEIDENSYDPMPRVYWNPYNTKREPICFNHYLEFKKQIKVYQRWANDKITTKKLTKLLGLYKSKLYQFLD